MNSKNEVMIALAPHDLCTGCTSCMNVCNHQAIRMQTDREGFLHPVIDEQACVGCGLCAERCPVLHPIDNANDALPFTFAVWSHKDRRMSSSGGAFSAFARMVLKNNGTVWGTAWDDHGTCRHIEVNEEAGLDALRGSKYVQSELGDVFNLIKKQIKQGRHVLFCGTPCQVAGLKSYLHRPYDNLLTLDLVCHGVPSDAVYKGYLQKISSRFAAKVDRGEFRDRDGWGKAPSVSVGGKFRPVYGVDSLYMEAFNASAIFRECCYQCPYACLPRIGDCTLEDFWGIGRHGKPFKHGTMKGVSLVLANNAKGKEALSQLEDVFVEQRTLDEALIENHNITHSSTLHPQRKEIVSAFLDPNKSLGDIAEEFDLVDRSLKGTVKEMASRLHLFDAVKYVYNKYKSL